MVLCVANILNRKIFTNNFLDYNMYECTKILHYVNIILCKNASTKLNQR